jgi:hypothetical protein
LNAAEAESSGVGAVVEPQPARHAMSITAASTMHTTFFIVSFLLFQWF